MNRIGVGLRACHYSEFETQAPPSVGWVEVISENYLPWKTFAPTEPIQTLLTIRKNIPVSMHGVSLNIASTDPLSFEYLGHLKNLIHQVDPIRVSDHLCWTGVNQKNSHDLLPFPLRSEFLNHIAARVDQVQEFLGRSILLENVSAYAAFSDSEMSEGDFLCELNRRTGCGILLDVNNIYVSAQNQKFDPLIYLHSLKDARIEEMHLAGFEREGDQLIDTHGAPVHEPVWELFRETVKLIGPRPTLLERDANIPEWSALEPELLRIGREYATLV